MFLQKMEKVGQLAGTDGYFVRCAMPFKDKAYLSGRRTKRVPQADGKGKTIAVSETSLFESTDGLEWKLTSVYQDNRGDETSFVFAENGELIGVTRKGEPYQNGNTMTFHSSWVSHSSKNGESDI
ncbi:MAG: hypothetical protein KAH20_15060 [Methylococcales bacterium]|nr:hypothetical protein [Methylococcales bacterium]